MVLDYKQENCAYFLEIFQRHYENIQNSHYNPNILLGLLSCCKHDHLRYLFWLHEELLHHCKHFFCTNFHIMSILHDLLWISFRDSLIPLLSTTDTSNYLCNVFLCVIYSHEIAKISWKNKYLCTNLWQYWTRKNGQNDWNVQTDKFSTGCWHQLEG